MLEFDAKPEGKILFVWFFTKTITYSLVAAFFIFMILFFINMVDVLSEEKLESEVAVVQGDAKTDENNKTEEENIENPFAIIVDYWVWAFRRSRV